MESWKLLFPAITLAYLFHSQRLENRSDAKSIEKIGCCTPLGPFHKYNAINYRLRSKNLACRQFLVLGTYPCTLPYTEPINSKFCLFKQEGGQRNAVQVLSCSLFATILAVIHFFLVGVGDSLVDFRVQPWGATLLCAYLGFYACCAGDTWCDCVGDMRRFGALALYWAHRVCLFNG